MMIKKEKVKTHGRMYGYIGESTLSWKSRGNLITEAYNDINETCVYKKK